MKKCSNRFLGERKVKWPYRPRRKENNRGYSLRSLNRKIKNSTKRKESVFKRVVSHFLQKMALNWKKFSTINKLRKLVQKFQNKRSPIVGAFVESWVSWQNLSETEEVNTKRSISYVSENQNNCKSWEIPFGSIKTKNTLKEHNNYQKCDHRVFAWRTEWKIG